MMFLLLLAKFKIDIDKMKEKEKGIALLMGLVFMGMGAQAQTEPLKRMAIMSDVHLMAPELLKKEGKAFDDYIIHDRKMLAQSPELLDSACANVEKFHPQVVLITGDLTKDGELVSHQLLVSRYLQPMRNQGIRVFVIPGNHDVNNPHAVVYDGDDAKRTTTISKDDFARIYNDFGYGNAIARDSHSLSYVVQLDSKTRLIAVDACEYEDNDFDKNICVTAGRIKPKTLRFIKQQAENAHQKGMEVMMMMHHGLVRHFAWQDRVMKEYLVDHWKKNAKKIAKMGIKICFTGHFHAQDAAEKYHITDVETGSTVSYPHPYRLLDVDTDAGTLSIKSEHIKELSSMKNASKTLVQKSERYANSAVNSVAENMIPAKVPTDVKKECSDVLGEAYAMHLAGDEHRSSAFDTKFKAAVKHLRHYSWKWAFIMKRIGKYLSQDTGVSDNNLVIRYKR